MTPQEARKMLKAKLECLKRETSGTDIDCNYRNCDECNLCYEQGNMGEQKEALDMATKALEQQPCEDCISRQAVRRILANQRYELVKLHTVNPKDNPKADAMAYGVNWSLNTLMELPSVKPQQRWIPVSERLPEEDGFYLATCDGEICGEDEPISGMAEFENGKWVDDEDDYQCVLAWMPLPEPYKESELNPSYNGVKTELNRVLDRIITQIEQVRDKDKLCEYPYNRCIKIIEECRTGNSLVSVPAPKRKAAIERQVITTWFTPEEKLPEEDVCVLATVTATAGNKRFIRTVLPVFYCKSEGWYELDYGFSELTVHAWCDLEPYEGD